MPTETNYGDAVISEKHANFFVNKKNAKSVDMKSLINFVKKKVKDKILSLTFFLTKLISDFISTDFAFFLFTKKLACFSEITASP